MNVLVFTGPKGSGKDTCADILKKKKKLSSRVSFALPMKRICSKVFEVHMNLLNDPVLKEKPFKVPVTVTNKHLRSIKNLMMEYVDPTGEGTYYNPNLATDKLVGSIFETPRKMLQVIGTEFIRDEFHPDWHCMAAFSDKNLKIVLKGVKNTTIAVTDCRFPNEFTYLSTKFGENAKFFYVERPEAEKTLSEATHRSELEILKIKDLILQSEGVLLGNDGTIEDLTKKLGDVKLPKNVKRSDKTEPGSRFRFGPRQ